MAFDRDGLVAQLRSHVVGDVLADAGSRAIYSADASNYRHVPQAVILPRSSDDVVATLALCREYGAGLTMRGAGTSIAGNAIGAGVVLDTSRYLGQILAIDEGAATAVVQPGVIGGDLRDRLAPHGLSFAPDPSTLSRCTIGGMIGNNACGAHSVAWGKTSDNVRELDVLLADGTRMSLGPNTRDAFAANVSRPDRAGEVYRGLEQLVQENLEPLRTELGQFSRQLSGYALHQLLPDHHRNLARALVGSEGTCAIVLSATLDLVRPPAHRALLVLGFDDEVRAAQAVPELLGLRPLTIEGMSRAMFAGVRLHGERASIISALPQTPNWLFVETGGETPSAAEESAKDIARKLGLGQPGGSSAAVFMDPRAQRVLWGLRSDGSGLATRTVDGRAAYPGFEDAAVPPEMLAGYLREFRELLAEHGLFGISYGHFGEGCIHIRLDADLSSPGGVGDYRQFLESAADLIAAHGGSISGEHGDGQARSELLTRTYSPRMIGLFERFKGIWDPEDVLNPGILVRPRKLDANVRWLDLGTREVQAQYAYPDDEGSFRQAVSRCVGVGKCRVEHGAAMCPSYQATHDEKDSTRGRARLLFEMLEGSSISDGWRSTEVLDALDLCLSCKACKVECPVNVDMATYKSEFLFHHYRRRLRPRAHYALGRLPQWARLASLAPTLVNKVTSNPTLARLGKAAAGVDPRRELPAFAPVTLHKLARARTAQRGTPGQGTPGQGTRGQVLLWPDTFTNHLSPQVGMAAMDVLEDAGFEVLLPEKPVCCGLTAISTGQLPLARRVASRSLDVLAPYLAQGIPVIGLEPSCTAVLRTELTRLLPDDGRARLLAESTRTFAEQLAEHADGWTPPWVDTDAVVQTHCHQYSDLGDDPDRRLMTQAGIRPADMSPGCCGLAGNFGFEDGHYEVSMAVAELNLLPAIRGAGPHPNVIADGFSCRTQVHDGAGLPARHLAEVLAAALGTAPPPPQ